MRRKATLLELLAHPLTQDAIHSLSKGNDPRGVLAGLAGDLVAQEVAKAIGARRLTARAPEPAPKSARAPAASRTSRAPRPKVEVMRDDDVVDAEYTVIDVTPRGAKKAG